VKYPKGITSQKNHARDYCDDGVAPKFGFIPFPIPLGIIESTKLKVSSFKAAALHLNEKVVQGETLSVTESNLQVMINAGLRPGEAFEGFWCLSGLSAIPENEEVDIAGEMYIRLV
jgi:hypothetical protein